MRSDCRVTHRRLSSRRNERGTEPHSITACRQTWRGWIGVSATDTFNTHTYIHSYVDGDDPANQRQYGRRPASRVQRAMRCTRRDQIRCGPRVRARLARRRIARATKAQLPAKRQHVRVLSSWPRVGISPSLSESAGCGVFGRKSALCELMTTMQDNGTTEQYERKRTTAWKSWPGKSNGKAETSGHQSVTTPDECPRCGGEISDDLPNHLRYHCDGDSA